MPGTEETDLTYEGIETVTLQPPYSTERSSLEETDLTYEGIETRVPNGICHLVIREETDLTYEGIETSP